MMSCHDFEPGTSHTYTPTTGIMRIGDGIAVIPWVYEGLQCDVIESCLMFTCRTLGTDWSSMF